MKYLIAIVISLISATAFAQTYTVEQVRGSVTGFTSMSEISQLRGIKQWLPMLVRDCKALRGNDPQCELSGTKPVAATVHFTLGLGGPSILPTGAIVHKGDLVVSQSGTSIAPRILQVLDTKVCGWHTRLLDLGGQQIECADDAKNGWEQGTAVMVRYPEKFTQSTTH